VLAPTQVALAKEAKCFDWPVATRPIMIAQYFHDSRQIPPRLLEKVNWPIGLAHDGLDIALTGGTTLRALANGKVVAAGLNSDGTGGVVVRAISGLRYLFAHLYSVKVRRGERIRRGQILGYSGGEPGVYGSGPYTTGPHLHLAVFNRFDEAIDPLPLFCRDAKR
jgi:murein DD-endopeptidase MepM/ murein hydrolase activator NlpD